MDRERLSLRRHLLADAHAVFTTLQRLSAPDPRLGSLLVADTASLRHVAAEYRAALLDHAERLVSLPASAQTPCVAEEQRLARAALALVDLVETALLPSKLAGDHAIALLRAESRSPRVPAAATVTRVRADGSRHTFARRTKDLTAHALVQRWQRILDDVPADAAARAEQMLSRPAAMQHQHQHRDGAASPQAVAEWIDRTFPTAELQRLMASVSGERSADAPWMASHPSHGAFWAALVKAALRGHTSDVQQCIAAMAPSHAVFGELQQHLSGTVRRDRIASLLSRHAGSLDAWPRTLLSVLAGNESVIVRCAATWFDALAGLCNHAAHSRAVPALVDMAVARFSTDADAVSALDIALQSLISGRYGAALRELAAVDMFIAAHIAHFLVAGLGLFDGTAALYGLDDVVSRYLAQYASSIAPLWRVALDYSPASVVGENCETERVPLNRSLAVRDALSSPSCFDAAASTSATTSAVASSTTTSPSTSSAAELCHRLLSLELADAAECNMQAMAMLLVSQMAAAVPAADARHQRRLDELVDALLREFLVSRDMSRVELAVQALSAHAPPLVRQHDGALFLAQYNAFADHMHAAASAEHAHAASVASDIVSSSRCPAWFVPTLLGDAVPLLENQAAVLFGIGATEDLLRALEHAWQHADASVRGDLRVVRLALARNMARAIAVGRV